MLNKVFGQVRVDSYGKELEKYIPGATYHFGSPSILTIPCGKENIEVKFEDIRNVKEAKDRFSNAVTIFANAGGDFLTKAEIISWYNRLPERLKEKDRIIHTSMTENIILENEDYLSFFKEIRNCFDNMIIQEYAFTGLRAKLFFLNSSGIDISIGYRDNFIEDFVDKFVNQCVSLNKGYSLDYHSSEKLRNGFSKMLEMSISDNTRNIIKKAMEQLPYTKEDYIKIYTKFLENEKRECFEYNISKICDCFENIKKGKFQNALSLQDMMEMGKLLESLENMKYNQLSQKDKEDYEKAKHIAYLMGYKTEIFEETENYITFPDNATAVIGEYFYIENQGAIIPNFDKFDNLPKEFFDAIDKIEERESNLEEIGALC